MSNMGGNHSRRKGSAFEREVAALLRPIFNDAKRGLGQTRGASEAPDVDGCGPFFVECKRGARTYPRAALKQAQEAMGEAHAKGRREHFLPVAICRDDRDVATVTMYLSDWLALVGEWERGK